MCRMHAKNNRVYMMTAVFIRVIINRPEAKNLYILPIFPYKIIIIIIISAALEINFSKKCKRNFRHKKEATKQFRDAQEKRNNFVLQIK